jgi:hypothetical protein
LVPLRALQVCLPSLVSEMSACSGDSKSSDFHEIIKQQSTSSNEYRSHSHGMYRNICLCYINNINYDFLLIYRWQARAYRCRCAFYGEAT